MLYTRKGDDGKTKTFGCDQRISKSSAVAEALGSLDEVNSFLGIIKTNKEATLIRVGDMKSSAPRSLDEIIHRIQENLFIIQAEVAGAGKSIDKSKVKEVESIVTEIKKVLPPIKSFFISGGTSVAAALDFGRTLARRAERRVVAVAEEGLQKIDPQTLAYLNRLSSLLYALARLSNHKSGIEEKSPSY
jgi:cob(I)alamin adenosyltransferase